MEHADARKAAKLWTPAPLPALGTQKRTSAQLRETVEGVIETFTIVHITPDGFLAPLALALIRAGDGTLLMAQGEDDTHLKIGQEVYVRRMDGLYLFTVKSQLQKVQEAFTRLWRRRPTADKTKENRSGGTR